MLFLHPPPPRPRCRRAGPAAANFVPRDPGRHRRRPGGAQPDARAHAKAPGRGCTRRRTRSRLPRAAAPRSPRPRITSLAVTRPAAPARRNPRSNLRAVSGPRAVVPVAGSCPPPLPYCSPYRAPYCSLLALPHARCSFPSAPHAQRPPSPPEALARTPLASTRRVQLVREEGRDASS